MQGSIHLDGLEDLLRALIREELGTGPGSPPIRPVGFLNVESAAKYLDTSQGAIRALVKRQRIPVHKTERGRLLFDPAELEAYVRGRADG